MEDLIKQAFAHVDVIGPHVHEGHYDLMGPDGEIILPIIWDKTIQPGWQVTMRMWPMDKHPLQGSGSGMPGGIAAELRNMSPEQRQRYIHQMQMRQAQGGHHGHGARAMPMRPPPHMMQGMPGGMPPPPPPPGPAFGAAFRPTAGNGSRMPPNVDVVDVKPERKRNDGKAAKKTMSFFAGTKKPPKKSSSSKKYVHQTWY